MMTETFGMFFLSSYTVSNTKIISYI